MIDRREQPAQQGVRHQRAVACLAVAMQGVPDVVEHAGRQHDQCGVIEVPHASRQDVRHLSGRNQEVEELDCCRASQACVEWPVGIRNG